MNKKYLEKVKILFFGSPYKVVLILIIAIGFFLSQPNPISSLIIKSILKEETNQPEKELKIEKYGITQNSDASLNKLFAQLEASVKEENLLLEFSNKKNPLKPLFLTSKKKKDPNKTKLENLNYDELSLTAIISDNKTPLAMVETKNGMGFKIKIGTKIGTLGGFVKSIEKEKIVIEETTISPNGRRKRTVDMFLRKNF